MVSLAMTAPHPIPPTVNLHLLKRCNYRCGFCYAGFENNNRESIPQDELRLILDQLALAPHLPPHTRRKVTFVGGEPLLYPGLLEHIAYAKSKGLVTSLVTNGSRLTEATIASLEGILDWLTLSIDSLTPASNLAIGRAQGKRMLSEEAYREMLTQASARGIRVKINTVVNRVNLGEDFSAFISQVRPVRWKLFQVTRIEGENNASFSAWEISEAEFGDFVARHAPLRDKGVILVPETQKQIYGSYSMISPSGCFFDNSTGTYVYSRKIAEVGLENAFADVSFDLSTFNGRDGNYDPLTGLNREGGCLVKTIPLPPSHAKKLAVLIHQVEAGLKSHRHYHGKKLEGLPSLIAVPLGRRWRALFQETTAGCRFVRCLSHEAYNHLKRKQFS